MQRRIVVPILGLTFVAGLGGCTADSGDGGILVLRNVAADSTCAATASETELGIGHGRLDLLIPTGYLFIAQMKSRITALTGQEDQRTIVTSGANVDITFPNSTVFSASELTDLQTQRLTKFKTLFTTVVKPNGGITDAPFELVPGQLTEKILAKVPDLNASFRLEAVATFTVIGDMSGAEITSQPFSYPITFGNGVVINVAGTCPLPKEFGMPRTGYACNPAQDGIVDCCQTTGGLRCPATVSTM